MPYLRRQARRGNVTPPPADIPAGKPIPRPDVEHQGMASPRPSRYQLNQSLGPALGMYFPAPIAKLRRARPRRVTGNV